MDAVEKVNQDLGIFPIAENPLAEKVYQRRSPRRHEATFSFISIFLPGSEAEDIAGLSGRNTAQTLYGVSRCPETPYKGNKSSQMSIESSWVIVFEHTTEEMILSVPYRFAHAAEFTYVENLKGGRRSADGPQPRQHGETG